MREFSVKMGMSSNNTHREELIYHPYSHDIDTTTWRDANLSCKQFFFFKLRKKKQKDHKLICDMFCSHVVNFLNDVTKKILN